MNRPQFPSPTTSQTAASSSLSTDTVHSLVSASGTLTSNHCAAARYTLIDDGPTASAFTPWTAALGGATPCYSTLPATATTTLPPAASDAAAARATVTVTDTVFAMQYAVNADRAALSPGGIAGAIIGGALFAGMLLWVYIALRRRHRRNQTLKKLRAEFFDAQGLIPGSSEVPVSPGASSHPFNHLTQADMKSPPDYGDNRDSEHGHLAPDHAELSTAHQLPPQLAIRPVGYYEPPLSRSPQIPRGRAEIPHAPGQIEPQLPNPASTHESASSTAGPSAHGPQTLGRNLLSTGAHPEPVRSLSHLSRNNLSSKSDHTPSSLHSGSNGGGSRPKSPLHPLPRPPPILQKPDGFRFNPPPPTDAEIFPRTGSVCETGNKV
ncbi:uncharacterized protein P884DRAFT_271230 [Thermothelomyces heterothallicus CBS 202.75]|uniref:uncharacterized protein n=1 Tax=Thermothelomyces heterothallicus CBS 202.75 TaxID=1149848 RepID=UPI0037422978